MILIKLLLDRDVYVELTYSSVSLMKLVQHSEFTEITEVLSSKLTTELTVLALSLGIVFTCFWTSLKSILKEWAEMYLKAFVLDNYDIGAL